MKWQQIRLWLAVLALLILSALGFWGLVNEWHWADNLGRRFSTAMQTAYSSLGLVAALVLLMKQRWSRGALYAWAGTLIFTGVTAPVAWGEGGWSAGLSAAAIIALIAGLVIWLAPLPPPSAMFKRWRWVMASVFGIAALVALSMTVQKVAPLVVHGTKMEAFCEGMQRDVDQEKLRAIAEQQGYVVQLGNDAKGPYMRIEDDASRGHYFCEARFKKDGMLDTMNFTAKASNGK